MKAKRHIVILKGGVVAGEINEEPIRKHLLLCVCAFKKGGALRVATAVLQLLSLHHAPGWQCGVACA